MRKLLLVVCLLLPIAFRATAQEEDTVGWLDNYQKALEEAKRTNKPIFLEFRCEA